MTHIPPLRQESRPTHTSRLQPIWDALTAPSLKLTRVDDQHKARLLASMLGVIIVLGLGLAPLQSILNHTLPLTDPIFLVSIFTCVLLAVAYVMSRTRYYQVGTVIALLVLVLAVEAAAIVDPDSSPGVMAFMLLPIILGCMLLPVRALTALIAFCLVLIATFPLIQSGLRFVDMLVGQFSLTLIVSLMLVMLLDYRERVEAERRAALAASEQRYRKLIEHSPDMIAVRKADQFLFMNSAGVKLLGATSAEEIMKIPAKSIVVEEDYPLLDEATKHLTPEISKHLEFRLRRLDQQVIEVEGTGTLIEFMGEPALQVVIRDITQRKQDEMEMRRLRLGIEHSGEAIFMTNPDGHIVYVNPAFERIYGYDRDEAIGQTPRILKSGTLPPEMYDSLWKMLMQKHVVYGQMTNRRKDGMLIEVESTASPVLDEQGNILGFLAIQRDITERRMADQALQHYANRLELLHAIDNTILTTTQVGELAERVLTQLRLFVAYHRATITLFDFKALVAERLAASGVEIPILAVGSRVPLSLVKGLDTMRMGQPYLADISEAGGALNELDQQRLNSGVKAYVSIPLITHGELIGAVNVSASDPRELTPFVLETLREVSDQIAIAIEDARLRAALQKHSEQLEAEVEARTQELRTTKERAEAILNSAPDPMLLIRPDGYIETGNSVLVQMFGYTSEEMHQATLWSFISTFSHPEVQHALEIVVKQGEPLRREAIAQRKDSSTFDAEIAFAPIHGEGEITGVVCTLRDISTLKEVERMKDAFVSNVSHELRTPITSLKLYHQLLVMNPNKYEHYVASLQREMNRLERIVEDLLMLSRLEQGRVWVGKAPTDLNKLIEDYITDRDPMAKQHQLELSFTPQDALPPIQADRSLVGHVLSILLTNALNYTPPGGAVRVTTQASTENGAMIAFSVCDTGPGIPAEERDQLFQRFFRGSASRAVNAPGTGLGLAIAREIVDLHGGRIEVDSPTCAGPEGSTGATFTVWMPRAG